MMDESQNADHEALPPTSRDDEDSGVSQSELSSMRAKAEERARERRSDAATGEIPDAAKLLYELQVHQIELEMQNQELRDTQLALEDARAKYFDLYDVAPVGYVTLDAQGVVIGANLTASRLLGVDRADLIDAPLTRFVASEDQDDFYLRFKGLASGSVRPSPECAISGARS